MRSQSPLLKMHLKMFKAVRSEKCFRSPFGTIHGQVWQNTFWQGKLSLGKRIHRRGWCLTLIKSILFCITMDVLSLLPIHCLVQQAQCHSKKLYVRIFPRWFQMSSHHQILHVKWDIIKQPLLNRLGIGHFIFFSEALLCKWLWWRSCKKKNNLWRKVIRPK